MSYNVYKTNGEKLITVLDGTATGETLDTKYSLTFIGKNYPNYGRIQQENFLKLLENGAADTSPVDRHNIALTGELWYDTANEKLKIYDGAKFKTIGSSVSAAAPTNANAGDAWWDTVNDQFKTWTGTDWAVVGPSFSKLLGQSGAIVETITDGLDVDHTIVSTYINTTRTSILSQTEFTPKVAIAGYPVIKAGMNINFGSGNGFAVAQSDNNTEFVNNQSNGNISIRANISGTVTTALSVNGVSGLITVAGTPTNTLGIATKGYVDTQLQATSTTIGGSLDTVNAALATLTTNAAVQSAAIDSINALKADLASPEFTGTPLTTTADGSLETQITNVVYVGTAIETANLALKQNSQDYTNAQINTLEGKLTDNVAALNSSISSLSSAGGTQQSVIDGLTATKANIANPTFTGTPLAPTAPTVTNNTQIATTAFVKSAITATSDALWKGSNKYVSSLQPQSTDGVDGDIWFQV